jgi:hypothetical protein
MTSGLQMSVKREAVDKATCHHYGYPAWVCFRAEEPGKVSGPLFELRVGGAGGA